MELNPHQERLIATALKTSAPAKHSVRSAIRHLERSWQLVETMPEISAFLAITAEEEAATAVFHALKKRKYAGAKQINYKLHRVKNALYPFLLAIRKTFSSAFTGSSFDIFFESNNSKNEDTIGIRIPLKSAEGQVFYGEPPMRFFCCWSSATLRYGGWAGLPFGVGRCSSVGR